MNVGRSGWNSAGRNACAEDGSVPSEVGYGAAPAD